MKRLLMILVWFPATLLTLFSVILFFSYRSGILHAQEIESITAITSSGETYKMYASTPKILGVSTTSVKTEDAIPELVYQYLLRYKSPMTYTSDDFVTTFRTYNIDPTIPLAIAQCESNLGKKMPEDCINPFGLGIHSRGKLCFENWQQGYEKMAEVLKVDYIDKGYTTIDDIMTKYCPISAENGGTWALCVKQFKEDIETLTIKQN